MANKMLMSIILNGAGLILLFGSDVVFIVFINDPFCSLFHLFIKGTSGISSKKYFWQRFPVALTI